MADMCTDNRFEVIEKFKKKLIESTNIETSPEEMMVIDNILFRFWQMGWLDKLDSESPNNWIPCSERMPDEHEWIGTKEFGTTISDEVYVTFENPNGERFCKHLSFQNKKLSDYDQHTIDAFYKGSKPITWMPLPEPYQEVEE